MSLFDTIKNQQTVFIIAEAGVNHNGDFELAKKLVDIAKEAGADAVKFQTFKTEGVVSKYAEMAEYQKQNIGKTENQFDMIKKLELAYEDFIRLKKYCDSIGIMFLSAPHSFDAIDFLDNLVPMYKVASGDLTNIPFLERIAQKQKPIILSTGMGNIEEIKEALDAIYEQSNQEVIVLQCTTSYPCELNDVNLQAMETIRQTFNVPVGYSDHTLGLDACKLAAQLGAIVLEKHFTADKTLPGPDHKASLEPDELKELVRAIRNKDYKTETDPKVILGSPDKRPTPAELKIAEVARKSIVAAQDIRKGTTIIPDMLIIKRPGTGLKPKLLKKIIGKRAANDIKADKLVLEKDLV